MDWEVVVIITRGLFAPTVMSPGGFSGSFGSGKDPFTRARLGLLYKGAPHFFFENLLL